VHASVPWPNGRSRAWRWGRGEGIRCRQSTPCRCRPQTCEKGQQILTASALTIGEYRLSARSGRSPSVSFAWALDATDWHVRFLPPLGPSVEYSRRYRSRRRRFRSHLHPTLIDPYVSRSRRVQKCTSPPPAMPALNK
jgi:hypothetical protein